MALIAINPEHVFEYSLEQDKSEDKTIFILGVIDSLTRAYIDDVNSIKSEDGTVSDSAVHNKYIQFVKFGLRGWRNLKDKDGKEIEFKTVEQTFSRLGKRTVVSDESIKALDLLWIIELGLHIVAHNKLSRDEIKN